MCVTDHIVTDEGRIVVYMAPGPMNRHRECHEKVNLSCEVREISPCTRSVKHSSFLFFCNVHYGRQISKLY